MTLTLTTLQDALDVQERSALCSVARWFCLVRGRHTAYRTQ